MMEVTPHLKTVLKNYQHSATKSLQGPGVALKPLAKSTSPELKVEEDEYVAPSSFPVQQVPILTTADTSCSERSETILEGETISCFIVGGEKRLCLPQVLNSVLREFSLQQINQECDQLHIYCSRCTLEQLNVLKNQAILPSGAPSCGLITKTDAERLCSALLHPQLPTSTIRPPKDTISFKIYHQCFGKSFGICYPELYVAKNAKCIKCLDCQNGFSPQHFVCHVHRDLENRTIHWGFDSSQWRNYMLVPKDHHDYDHHVKILDDMFQQYEGKLPFPQPIQEPTIKRKQISTSDIIKELPLKKQKLDEFMNVPYKLNASLFHQVYSNIDPQYIHQYLHEYNSQHRHLSAFKPVTQTIKESKIRHANALGITTRYADPPVLQNPERVVRLSESERFERTFQPNVALAPPTPKKRYGKVAAEFFNKEAKCEALNTEELVANVIVQSNTVLKSPPPQKPKYNPEIELSTDTDDSASETSEQHKIEDVLNGVDDSIKSKILDIFRTQAKEQDRLVAQLQEKENIISELQVKYSALENAMEELKKTSNNNNHQNSDCSENHNNCSSIIITIENGDVATEEPEDVSEHPTVIAKSVEQPAIIKSAVE